MSKHNKLQVLNAGGIAIVSTPSMEYMAREAYRELRAMIKKKSVDFHVVDYHSFSRGEVLPEIQKNVRMKSVYLFYDFNGDACHDAFALLLTISALQSSDADSITLVTPFIPFLRQDRKDRSRVPISAKDMIDLMEMREKVKRVITLDMHADQSQMGFKNPSDHLPGHVIFVPWIKERFAGNLDQLVIVGPDAGSEKRVKGIAKRVGCKRAFFTKERDGSNVEIQEIHGANVKDKICLINDDIIDTGGTIIKSAKALLDFGAKEVVLSATHPVFGESGGTTIYEKFANAGFEVVVTDSIRTEEHDWLTVLPLARYMGHAILQNNIVDGSVSQIITEGLPPKMEKEHD